MTQKELFRQIWQERPHKSEVSGQTIPELKAHNFAHILGKGAYPGYKLNKENIILLTAREHHLFDNRPDKIKGDPKWGWVFEKREQLKRQYYG